MDLILKERRLRWYRHVERSNGAVKTTFDIQVAGKRGPGRPKMTWRQLTDRDCKERKLSAIDPHDREEGPLMWMLPLYMHVIKQNPVEMMMMMMMTDFFCT